MSTQGTSFLKSPLGRTVLIVAGVVVVGFIVLLLASGQRTNPPVVSEPNWDSPETRALAKRACFDCHSNETVWPWYSYIPPFSGMIIRDVQVGRTALNFSDWGSARGEARSAGEIAEVIGEGEMPPANYLRMHPTARLTQAEKEQLIAGLRATLAK
jgi:hypothetical protein